MDRAVQSIPGTNHQTCKWGFQVTQTQSCLIAAICVTLLAFYCCITNHHNLSSLNNTRLSSHNSLYPMWARQANIKLSAGLCSFMEALEENLFLCSFRWLLLSLAVVGLKFLSPCWLLVRAVPAFLDSWPPSSRFKVSSDESNVFHIQVSHVSSSIASLCLTLLPCSSIFKGSCDNIGSTQTIQDKILIQKSMNLIPSTMSLLLYSVTHSSNARDWSIGIFGGGALFYLP